MRTACILLFFEVSRNSRSTALAADCPTSHGADIYEAFVLWSFFKCMVESFGSHEMLMMKLEAKGRRAMMSPCCCIRIRLTYRWLQWTTLGVVQYIFVRVVLSVIVFIVAIAGKR